MLTIGVELIMLPPVPVIEPPLPFGVLRLTRSTTAPAIPPVPPRAERPEQAEDQERDEDEAGEEVPIMLDHDRLPIGRRHHLGMVGAMVAPVAISEPGSHTDRNCDRQQPREYPASHQRNSLELIAGPFPHNPSLTGSCEQPVEALRRSCDGIDGEAVTWILGAGESLSGQAT